MKNIQPFPQSRRIYVAGSRADLRVPMREITQSPTGAENNPPVFVYDTLGAFGDESQNVDIKKGLPAVCAPWINERSDTEELAAFSSQTTLQKLASEERFPVLKMPRRAKNGNNVSQMHYAKKGIVTPEM